jgi:fibronectin-binding autotransporter adhesin
VQINTSGITVSHSSTRNDFVHSLTSKAAINISAGQLYLGGASTVAALTMARGMFGGNGTITGPGNLTITGLLTWSAGTMAGNGTTTAAGGVLFNGNGSFGSATETLDGRKLNNVGSATWNGNNNIVLNDGAVINNEAAGSFVVQNNMAVENSAGAVGVITNLGTFTKSTGGGTTTVNARFNNSGTVNLTNGSLDLTGASVSSGKFTLAASDTLTFGGLTTLTPSSNITGPGNLVFDPGTSNGFSTSPSVANVLGTIDITGSTGSTKVSGGTVNFAGPLISMGSQLAITGSKANFSRGFTTAPKTLTINGAAANFAVGFTTQTLNLTGTAGFSSTTATLAGFASPVPSTGAAPAPWLAPAPLLWRPPGRWS